MLTARGRESSVGLLIGLLVGEGGGGRGGPPAPACTDLKSAVTAWNAVIKTDLPALNATLGKNNLKAITGSAALAVPSCSMTRTP
jgi:hypothetical protein